MSIVHRTPKKKEDLKASSKVVAPKPATVSYKEGDTVDRVKTSQLSKRRILAQKTIDSQDYILESVPTGFELKGHSYQYTNQYYVVRYLKNNRWHGHIFRGAKSETEAKLCYSHMPMEG